jgi:hypothetical protein
MTGSGDVVVVFDLPEWLHAQLDDVLVKLPFVTLLDVVG